MIKLLGGRLQPDSGIIRLAGKEVRLSGPEHAHRLGAWTVFQELMLFPGMTVAENLMLGREPRGPLGVINHRRMGVAAEKLLADMGIFHIDPLALIEDISLAQRQIVEIVRALSHEPDILFLDEPTSSLVEREVSWLFGADPRAARSWRVRGLHLASLERGPQHRRPHHRVPQRPRCRHLHRARRERSGYADDRPAARYAVSGAPAARPCRRRCCACRAFRAARAGGGFRAAPRGDTRHRRACRPGPSRAVPAALRRRAGERRAHRRRRAAGAHPQPARGEAARPTAWLSCRRTARPKACCWA